MTFFFVFTVVFILFSEYVGYKIFGDHFSQTYKDYLYTTSRIFGAFYRGSIDDDYNYFGRSVLQGLKSTTDDLDR